MNHRSVAMTAACLLAGGLALSGCQPNNSGSTSGSSTTAQAGGAAGAGGSASPTASSGSGAQSGSGGSGVCQASDLKISLSGTNNVSSQIIQWVQLSNTSSASCTMDGFAGVDLVGAADGQSGYSWSLGRDNTSYSKVTLAAGEAAYFGIEYLPWASGDGRKLDVAKIELTPPNTTTTVSLPFSASVLLQDTATHSGTFLTPVALGRTP